VGTNLILNTNLLHI